MSLIVLVHTTGIVHDGYALRYRASKADCDVCAFKMRYCPSTPMRTPTPQVVARIAAPRMRA